MASSWTTVQIIDVGPEQAGQRLVNFSVAGIKTETELVPDKATYAEFISAAKAQMDPYAQKYAPEATEIIYNGFGLQNPAEVAKFEARLDGRS